MLDVIIDTLKDTAELIPFLFFAFLILEYIEHRLSKENKKRIEKSGKFGPLVGSLLGAIPQCGFGAMATNLYAARTITLGTLIAIYLSTSDEMLPIMLSQNVELSFAIKIVLVKVAIGMICGFIIDFFYRNTKGEVTHICEEEKCHCEHGILKSSLKHTFNIVLFILVVTFLINIAMYLFGEERLSTIFMKGTIFGPFISSLIGLIPNCGASVALTELYLEQAISIGSLIGGLLTGSGVALLLLFRVNKNTKENINIVALLYAIGVICGIIIDLFI